MKGFLAKHALTLWICVPVCILMIVGVIAEANRTWEIAQITARPQFAHELYMTRLRQIYSGAAEDWPAPHLDSGVTFRDLAAPALPDADARQAPLAMLGEKLFEDPALSASGHVSCQSCHNRHLGWGDGLPRSFGHARRESTRNAQPLFAMVGMESFFWDGRAETLEEQSLGPLLAAHEMANDDLSKVLTRVAGDQSYEPLFVNAFGDPSVKMDRISRALAAFQLTLDRATPLDRFLRGRQAALSDDAIWGLHLFRTKARCINCHMGPHLTDNRFHNIGLSYYNRSFEDAGRYAVTGQPRDVGRFRTPSLRHVSRTAPYMHNGLFPHLKGIVNLYAAGGGRSARKLDDGDPLYPHAARTSEQLEPLTLSPEEREALVAFLESI